jgi:hypothetical protein
LQFGDNMLAIHQRSGSFSDKWSEYCRVKKIPFKIVNCYNYDIVDELRNCDGLMWHWQQNDYKAILFAKQLIYSLEKMGKKVFPSFATCFHFDDKVGQKYLLEAIGAPLAPSYIFYDKVTASKWAETAAYPKVFKLRGGAGSENVQIVKNLRNTKKLISRAFGNGFKAKSRTHYLKERLWAFKRDRSLTSLVNISKGIARLFIPKIHEIKLPREKNYLYFQEFIPENTCDIRIIVIGKRAFAIKRMVRKNDFRASGSGRILYDQEQIPINCVTLSFELTKKLNNQCLAFDYVFKNEKPLLIEISYGFNQKGYLPCPGYWDDSLKWHNGKFIPEWFMIEDFISECING